MQQIQGRGPGLVQALAKQVLSKLILMMIQTFFEIASTRNAP